MFRFYLRVQQMPYESFKMIRFIFQTSEYHKKMLRLSFHAEHVRFTYTED